MLTITAVKLSYSLLLFLTFHFISLSDIRRRLGRLKDEPEKVRGALAAELEDEMADSSLGGKYIYTSPQLDQS